MFDRDDWSTIAAFSSAVAAVAALIGLCLTYFSNKRTQDEKTFETIRVQAENSLAAAYDTLTNRGRSIPPEPDRLNWLTAARHILRYKKLKQKLRGVHHLVLDEVEEYWRHKVYLAVQPLERSIGYYSGRGSRLTDDSASPLADPIEPKSALVVLMFSEWPAGLIDPLDEITTRNYEPIPRIFRMRHAAFASTLDALIERENRNSQHENSTQDH